MAYDTSSYDPGYSQAEGYGDAFREMGGLFAAPFRKAKQIISTDPYAPLDQGLDSRVAQAEAAKKREDALRMQAQGAAISGAPMGMASMEGARAGLDTLPGGPSDVTSPDSNIENPPPGIHAVRQNGRTIFTNDPGLSGEAQSYGEATRSFREAGAGTQIVSPYDRDIFGESRSSAMTGSDPGSFIASQTDWSKVANPMGFEGFRETPTGQVLQQREADFAKAQADEAEAEALTKDPFARERMIQETARHRDEADVRAAGEPYRLQRQYDVEDEKILAQLGPQLQAKLQNDPEFRRLTPEEQQAYFRDALFEEVDRFKQARGKFTYNTRGF